MRSRHLEDKWLRAAFVWSWTRACRSEWGPSGKHVASSWTRWPLMVLLLFFPPLFLIYKTINLKAVKKTCSRALSELISVRDRITQAHIPPQVLHVADKFFYKGERKYFYRQKNKHFFGFWGCVKKKGEEGKRSCGRRGFFFFFFYCWFHFGRVEGSLNGRKGEGRGEASKAACQQVAAV